MELSHTQEIESVRRQVFAHKAELRRMAIEWPLKFHRIKAEARQERIREAEVSRKVMAKIIADRHAMKLPGDSTDAGPDTEMDEDTRLANEIFEAAGGSTGKELVPDHNENPQDDEDEILAESLFQQSAA
jgi:hypothetical protein